MLCFDQKPFISAIGYFLYLRLNRSTGDLMQLFFQLFHANQHKWWRIFLLFVRFFYFISFWKNLEWEYLWFNSILETKDDIFTEIKSISLNRSCIKNLSLSEWHQKFIKVFNLVHPWHEKKITFVKSSL